MPYISTEALVGGVLLVVLAFGYQYLPTSSTSSTDPASTSSKPSKKKQKKKTKASSSVESAKKEPPAPTHVSSVPLPQAGNASNSSSKTTSGSSSQSPTSPSEQASSKPKTLAERIAPKPRKSKVDDMLAPEDRPATHARVMKITSTDNSSTVPSQHVDPPVQQKLEKFSDDYTESSDEDEGTAKTEEDDGWDVVPSKKKKPVSLSFSQNAAAQSTSIPLPISTKVQRKNAKKAEAKKAAKAADEAERLRRLALHKKELERERINDLYGSKKAADKKAQASSSMARAKLDANGQLIWD